VHGCTANCYKVNFVHNERTSPPAPLSFIKGGDILPTCSPLMKERGWG